MAKSIRLNSELWKRVEEYLTSAGYSSPEEFVEHLIERELAHAEEEGTAEAGKEAVRRLRGLGYLE